MIGHTQKTPEKCGMILFYQSIFVIVYIILKPTELWILSSCLSLISPSGVCCFEPNRHTELIVGSKSWLIMAVNHQRFWRWVRHKGNCCQTFVCVTGASRLSELAQSVLSPVKSFMSEETVTNEGLVNLYTPVKQQNLRSVMSWCVC